jgi:hypothetical protein
MNNQVKTIKIMKGISSEAATAERLYEIRNILKELAKEEKVLKQVFMDMGIKSFDAGDFLVSVVEKQREGLDSKSVIAEFGDRVKKFMKITEFKTVSVNRK